MHGNDDAAPQKQSEQDDQRDRTDEAEFLADDREDEVILCFGKIQIFLSAVAKSRTECAARTDGIQRLQKLISCGTGIIFGNEPVFDTFSGIVKECDGKCDKSRTGTHKDGKPFCRGTADENNERADHQKNHRRGQVFFQRRDKAYRPDDGVREQNTVTEFSHLSAVGGDVKCQHHDECQLHHFGRLNLNRTDFNPAFCTVYNFTDDRNQT